MENKQKILVCGDVKGKFKQLFNRVESINKKSGPFELLLCVGSFFDATANDELEAYKTKNKNLPVPTYILGPNSSNETKYYNDLKDGEICPNLTYLGKRGLYTVSSGLKIAYVSGIESNDNTANEATFTKDDVRSVKNSCFVSKTAMGEYRGIDILLTSQWPAGMLAEKKRDNGSKLISWLAMETKPRYHFCAIDDVYYEPAPYRNSVGSNTQLELASRFITLASVGNARKDKYIYALNVTPVDKLRVIELIQKTTNETACPYTKMNLMIENPVQSNDNSAQYFYDMQSFDNDNNGGGRKRRGLGFENEPKRSNRRQEFDQDKCWFCLSSPSVEKHLVITIGSSFYLALAKGPIDETHLLILSVTHIQSASLLSTEDWAELDKFKSALRSFYKSQNKVVTFFERNYKSSHLQINAIAVDSKLEWQLKNTFDDKAEEYKLNLEQLPTLTEPTQLPDRGAYFAAELPNGITLLTRQMKMFPLHFGREVFCAETLLDCESKYDWKECLLSKKMELDVVKGIRENFKPFDFTLDMDD